MIDLVTRNRPGGDSGSLACFIGALGLALLSATAAHAGAWEAFETRCLDALENLGPPVVAGLGQGTRDGDVTRYALDEGRSLIVEQSPQGGIRACAVHDPAGGDAPKFAAWIAQAVKAGRYVAVATGRWHSHLWIEPVLEVRKKQADGALTLQIMETDLEA